MSRQGRVSIFVHGAQGSRQSGTSAPMKGRGIQRLISVRHANFTSLKCSIGEVEKVTAIEAFNLSEKQWNEVEDRYEAAMKAAEGGQDQAISLLTQLLTGLKPQERQALALGVMVGRMSVVPQ